MLRALVPTLSRALTSLRSPARSGRPRRTGLAALVLAAPLALAACAPSPAPTGPLLGADISWPQCPVGYGQPMPGAGNRFTVLGITAGRGFSTNPCLAAQVAWAHANRQLTGAYVVPNFPSSAQYAAYSRSGPYSSATRAGALTNVGYAMARSSLGVLQAYGLGGVPTVWLDVEVVWANPWSSSTEDNRNVLRGEVAAWNAAGHRVGFYSTGYQWGVITGGWQIGAPVWDTSGPASIDTARARCMLPGFTGQPVVLSQWWSSTHDSDLVCPSASTSGVFAGF